jgi:hypothetical protein
MPISLEAVSSLDFLKWVQKYSLNSLK